MTKAISGFSTIFKYTAGTLVAELSSIGAIDLKADTIDVTNHDSASGYKEFIGSLKDGGEVPIEGNFIEDNAGQLALMTSFGTGAATSFTITFPDGSTWVFNAVVTGVSAGNTADLASQLKFTATLKISGVPVFTGVTTLYNVVFTVTESVGGTALEGAVIVFNNETQTTGATGILTFANVAVGDKVYGCDAPLYTGKSSTITVDGPEAEAVVLVLT